jgi:hypothetical protein
LRCGKALEKLPVLLERMSSILVRFLDALQAVHIAFIDEGTFEAWNEPTARGSRRLVGIDLNKVRNRRALNAVVELSTQPNGFSLDQLTNIVHACSGWSADQYSTRNAAYDLAKLRGKMLVHPCRAFASLSCRPL